MTGKSINYEDEETGNDIYLVCYIANNQIVTQYL